MEFRDRIKEFRRVPAAALRANSRNWRTHPDSQRKALRGLLEDVGYASALIARELADGTLELIDGHLRAETTPDAVVPVLVLDVSEEEADKILATFDPVGEMAETNRALLDQVLADVTTDNEAVAELLEDVARRQDEKHAWDAKPPEDVLVPEVYQVVVECRDEAHQRALYERLAGEGLRCRVLLL